MNIPDDKLIKAWDECKNRSFNNSLAIQMKQREYWLYFLYHSSVKMLEVYLISNRTLDNLFSGETPTKFYAYKAIENV